MINKMNKTDLKFEQAIGLGEYDPEFWDSFLIGVHTAGGYSLNLYAKLLRTGTGV